MKFLKSLFFILAFSVVNQAQGMSWIRDVISAHPVITAATTIAVLSIGGAYCKRNQKIDTQNSQRNRAPIDHVAIAASTALELTGLALIAYTHNQNRLLEHSIALAATSALIVNNYCGDKTSSPIQTLKESFCATLLFTGITGTIALAGAGLGIAAKSLFRS